MDGANNKQLAFKNVLVQFAYYETRDAKGYLSFQCHDDTKDGYYFTNGKGIHVTWKKTSDFAPSSMTTTATKSKSTPARPTSV